MQRRGRVDVASVQAVALQCGVVVDEAEQAVLAAARQGGGELAAGGTRTVDQHAGQFLASEHLAVEATEPDPHEQSAQADEDEQQQWLDHAHGPRYAGHADGGEHRGVEQAVQGHGLAQAEHGVPAGVAEDGAVQAEPGEQGNGDRHGADDRPEVGHFQAQPDLESQVQGHPDGEHAQRDVHRHGERALDRARDVQEGAGEAFVGAGRGGLGAGRTHARPSPGPRIASSGSCTP